MPWSSAQVSARLRGPRRRMSGTAAALPSLTGGRPAGFHSQMLWGILFLALVPGRGPTTAKVSLPAFNRHTVWPKPLCDSTPPASLGAATSLWP